jgi:hypothetical protein
MEYWSDGLEAVGVRPRAQGVREETFLMHTTPLLQLLQHSIISDKQLGNDEVPSKSHLSQSGF